MVLDYENSDFPPDWIILESEAFDHTEAGDAAPTTGQLLVNVGPQGVPRGNFKFVLGGDQDLDIKLNAKDVIQSGVAKDYVFSIQQSPGDIQLRTNSLSSDWIDLQDR